MAEALAAEVADFGIKVTIIEPGAFHTEFQSSIKNSGTIAEYDAVREKLYAMFTPDVRTDSSDFISVSRPSLSPAAVSPITQVLLLDPLPPFRKWESSFSLLNGLQLPRSYRDARPPSGFRMFAPKSMGSS